MNFTLGELIVFSSWPDITLNKNDSELQMFTNYFNRINKEHVMNQMRNVISLFGNGEKSATEAKRFRTDGNKFYKDKDYERSLDSYNRSISLAPRDSIEFGLAVANRSAVLFDMEYYKECLNDINVVLKSEYPKDLRFKIFLRQSKCYLKLNLNFEVAKSLRRTQECVDGLKLDEIQLTLINDNIMVLKNQLKDHLYSNISDNESDEYILTEPSLKNGEHTTFLNASKVINFKYTNSLGRHVVAESDIKKGDVLFIEEPYSFISIVPVFVSKQKYTVCDYCFQRTRNFIPCTQCTVYLYCSDDCRQNAWNLTHHWDCLGKRRGIIMNNILQLCLSTICNAARDGFQTNVHDESMYGNRENNYPFVNKLLTNKNKLSERKLKVLVKYAVWLVMYLKNFTDYFDWLYLNPNRPEGCKEDLLNFVGGQLVKHFLQIICNLAIITDKNIVIDPVDLIIVENVVLGYGIYVSSALLNHSCVPNSAHSFCGTKRVIKATKNISKGTQVTINYLHNLKYEESEKSKELKKYMVNCSCPVCTDPRYNDFLSAYLCPRCSGRALLFETCIYAKCDSCDLVFNAIEYILMDQQIEELVITQQLSGDCNNFDLIYQLMKKTFHKYNENFLNFYHISVLYYYRNGKMKNCVDNARLSVEICETICQNTDLNYIAHYLAFTFVLAKYSNTLKKQNSKDYKKYHNETKEMIKKCIRVLEYASCTHNIKKLIVLITKHLNSKDDVQNDGLLIEQCD